MKKFKNKCCYSLKRDSKKGTLTKSLEFKGLKRIMAGVMIAVTTLLPLSACSNEKEINGMEYDYVMALEEFSSKVESGETFSDILVVSLRDLEVSERYEYNLSLAPYDYILLVRLNTEIDANGFYDYVNPFVNSSAYIYPNRTLIYNDVNTSFMADLKNTNYWNPLPLSEFLKVQDRKDLVKEEGYTYLDLIDINEQINETQKVNVKTK